MKQARRKVFNLIRDDDENTLSGTVFDGIIIVFILTNVLLVILDTFDMPGWFSPVYAIIEVVSMVVFSLEYLLRIWTAPLMYPDKRPLAARLKFIFSFMGLVDLLSILPIYIQFIFNISARVLQSLRVIRLLRIFKIGRYTDATRVISAVLRKKAHQLLSSTLIVFVLMVIASVMMYDIESAVQPDKFDNVFSAFWWAMSTVTTIGYGDLYPITTLGKILGTVFALLGIALVAIPTGIISAGFMQEANEKEHQAPAAAPTAPSPAQSASSDDKAFCPYCGHKLE